MAVKEISERARRIHKEAIVIDMLEALSPAKDKAYFKTVGDAGVTAIQATVPDVLDDLPAAITEIAQFYKLIEGTENAEIVSTAADIETAKKEGKVAIIAGMQDCVPLERNLDLIRVFYELRIRVMQLAYSQQNYLGAGCGETLDHGLTDRGREAIKELNRLGILVDVSHCGDKTAMDATRISEAPIAITHVTPAAVVEMRRAKSDDTIKAVAEKGGVIGQVVMTAFCRKRDKMGVRATLTDFVDIIDYLVNLVGVDHVGFGFDLVPFWTKTEWDAPEHMTVADINLYPQKEPPFEEVYVEGFNSISDTIRITEELVRHGYSDDVIKKILGGNWLRLIKDVWK